jgi:hypothetical protein
MGRWVCVSGTHQRAIALQCRLDLICISRNAPGCESGCGWGETKPGERYPCVYAIQPQH